MIAIEHSIDNLEWPTLGTGESLVRISQVGSSVFIVPISENQDSGRKNLITRLTNGRPIEGRRLTENNTVENGGNKECRVCFCQSRYYSGNPEH